MCLTECELLLKARGAREEEHLASLPPWYNGPHLPHHPLQTGSRLGVGVFVFDDDEGTDGGGVLNTPGRTEGRGCV